MSQDCNIDTISFTRQIEVYCDCYEAAAQPILGCTTIDALYEQQSRENLAFIALPTHFSSLHNHRSAD